jgi:hypothetical protein
VVKIFLATTIVSAMSWFGGINLDSLIAFSLTIFFGLIAISALG